MYQEERKLLDDDREGATFLKPDGEVMLRTPPDRKSRFAIRPEYEPLMLGNTVPHRHPINTLSPVDVRIAARSRIGDIRAVQKNAVIQSNLNNDVWTEDLSNDVANETYGTEIATRFRPKNMRNNYLNH